MAKDALERIVLPNATMIMRDGTVWIYQSSHKAFEMNLLGYAFPARIEKDGRVVQNSNKPSIIRMYDMLLVAIAPAMRKFDKRQWQQWWKEEWIRGGGQERLRADIKEQKAFIRRHVIRRQTSE